jgi:hypothetical protein
MPASSSPFTLPLCEAPGVTVFPGPNTAYTCEDTTIKLHSGTLRVILQGVPRVIESPEVVVTSSDAYLDITSGGEELTKLSLRDGILKIQPRNPLLPEIQLEGGQYTEVGKETIASPVSLGQDIAARDLVAASVFSRTTVLPVGVLFGSLIAIAILIFLLSRRKIEEK